MFRDARSSSRPSGPDATVAAPLRARTIGASDRPRTIEPDRADGSDALRALCALTTDWIVVCRLGDGAIVDVSDALCDRLGWARAAIVGAHGGATLFEDARAHDDLLRALQDGRSPREHGARLRARDGGRVEVSFSGRLARSGDAWVAVLVAPDATDRLRAERELRATKLALDGAAHELAVTLRTIGDGVILTDGWGRVLTLNPVAERLTKWSAADARGRPLREVFHTVRTGRASADPFSDVLNRRQDAASWPRAVLVARDGAHRDVAESVSALRREGGEGFGVVVVFREITAQCRLEAELQKNQRLEALGVLASGIAHDFNNILVGVLGNLGIARAHAGDAPIASRLAGAERATVRARGLVRQLLTLARGGAPVRAPASIAAVVSEAAHFALSGSRSVCRVAVDDDLGTFEVDADQIGRVIQNVVLNADQAMPDGGEIDVQVTAVSGDRLPWPAPGRFVRIAVRDRGPGIPEAVRDRIFEPYFTTKATGSGLGLAVCQSIVAQHGGWIDVASREGEGATFVIHLPASSAEAPADARDGDAHAHPSAGVRVLLLEDDDAVADIATGMLEELGCTVVHARSGEEAIAAYTGARDDARRRGPFDVVLVDLTVRGAIGGRACLARLRDLGCNARAILTSGYAPRAANDAAFDAVLPKPYSLDELRAALDAALDLPPLSRSRRVSQQPAAE